MGSAYDDENYKPDDGLNDQRILSTTEEVLNQINKRLLLLRKNNLFDLVNKRAIQSVSFYDTNVLVNHKHYRYVKILWNKLLEIKPQKSESEKLKFEQDVIKGLRSYAKTIITYALKNNLDFKTYGNYSTYEAKHPKLSNVSFKENNNEVFEMHVGEKRIKIVVIANLPENDTKLLALLKKENIYLFYYDENSIISNERYININPLDPDSVERFGILIRKYLLQGYLNNIKKNFKFKQLLRDYVKYIPTQFIEFDTISYTYKFHSYPKANLYPDDVIAKIEGDSLYKSKSRPDKETILNSLKELSYEIETNKTILTNEYLICFNCGERLHSHNIERLNYLKCPACNCLVDSTNLKQVILKIDDSNYSHLKTQDFGLDYLTLNMAEL